MNGSDPHWTEEVEYLAAGLPHNSQRNLHMKIGDMIESKYLKQSDVNGEVVVSVKGIKKVNVARDDEEADYKWIVQFFEFAKPMVLNATNIKRMGKALGDDTDGWTGNQVIVYVDEDIEFGGKVTGGLRIKAAGSKIAPNKPKSLDDANAELNDAPF